MTSVSSLRKLAAELLVDAGVPRVHAAQTAELLVLADVWGIASHGLMRLPYYLARLLAGGVNPRAELSATHDSGAIVAFDGNDGLGHWQLWTAAEEAATRAQRYGVSVASVASSSHCGCLGVYTMPALRHNLVSIVVSTGPAVMPAPGGATSILSTSPLAAGIPCRPRPVVVDLALSSVARGKIAAYAQRDEPLPAGWAVDTDGVPTTDPRAALAGMLSPIGGGKGFALAFLVEALAGAIVGPQLAVDIPDMFDGELDARPQRIGHLVVTLDPKNLSADGRGDDRLNALASTCEQSGGRVPGATRILPWELADSTEVELADDTLQRLTEWRQRL